MTNNKINVRYGEMWHMLNFEESSNPLAASVILSPLLFTHFMLKFFSIGMQQRFMQEHLVSGALVSPADKKKKLHYPEYPLCLFVVVVFILLYPMTKDKH